ncbi:dynamin family protein [Helicobacter pylori]|uniref:dynamin family protein n=1 Tax=Helicobacter pylori TaxID=210 RepID=UPI000EB1C69B|nr:dynamin-like GTPase family protein [Helicobacter pylori]
MSVNFFNGIFNNNSKAENHHNTEGLKERYDLIARILNAKTNNEGLEEYQSILDNEFLEFASGVDSLKEKEIALLMLQEIQKELQLVASYPNLFQKTIVAVGGGFSAGKSTFLNNLLGLKLKLPEHIDPTTAIPTYCLKGKKEVLMGFSQNGGMVELPNLAFNHQFLKSLGFNLKEIMPFMLLSAPSAPFEFLCFIDTPGYNPGNQGYSGDKEASKESLKHAKHILWLVSCECGDIESDDLEFLQELYEEWGKQVFIVLSRADRRTKSQLEEVAKQIKETLKDHGIEFLWIGAYSATRYQEYKEFSEKSHVFDSLEEFLMKLNQRSEKQNEILGYLYEVHSMYEKAIKQDASQFKRYQKALHSVKLDLMQKGFDDFSDDTFNKIHSLKKEFSEQERSKRENLARLNEVIDLFKESIDKVFDHVSAFTFEKYKEQNDDEEDDEANYREFEEIKKMALFFRDLNLFYLDWLELSEEEIQETRDSLDKCNELLQLHYSLKNLQRLMEFKEKENEDYQECLNDEELQNNLREWRDLRNTPEETNRREFEEIKKMALYFRDWCMFCLDWYEWSQEKIQEWRENVDYNNELLQLDYSLKNLSRFKEYKEDYGEDYQDHLNDEELQNNLREWRDLRNTPEETNRREFEEIKKMALYFRDWCMFRLDWYKMRQEEIQECRDWMDEDNELLQLDYSLKNLSRFKEYKEDYGEDYQDHLNDEELQNNLREWRRTKRR